MITCLEKHFQHILLHTYLHLWYGFLPIYSMDGFTDNMKTDDFMGSFLLLANIGRRDFGWFLGGFVDSGGFFVAGFGVSGLSGLSVRCVFPGDFLWRGLSLCAVSRRGFFSPPPLTPLSSPLFSSASLRSLQAFFGSPTHPRH
jgi:hypothetical protein